MAALVEHDKGGAVPQHRAADELAQGGARDGRRQDADNVAGLVAGRGGQHRDELSGSGCLLQGGGNVRFAARHDLRIEAFRGNALADRGRVGRPAGLQPPVGADDVEAGEAGVKKVQGGGHLGLLGPGLCREDQCHLRVGRPGC